MSWLCAVQSQDFGPAKWSVAQRASGVTDAEFDRAFDDGRVLRTHVLRPTWHFVHPADICWMLEVTGPRVQALNGHMYRQLELDAKELTRCSALIAAALRGRNFLTRKAIKALLEKSGVVTDGFRAAYILMNAELNGVICSGPLKGRQHTYALLEERAPNARSVSPDDALAELIVRYYTSHGPATVKDLRSWASLTIADIKRGLEMVAPRLEHEEIDGVRYWFSGAGPAHEIPSPTVHLLQVYDEYVMGYSESRHVLDRSGVGRSQPEASRSNLIAVLDGLYAGRWKRTIKSDRVIVETSLHRAFDASETEALRRAADEYGEFLGVPAVLA